MEQDETTQKLIQEQKQIILTLMKSQNLDKESAKTFLDFAKDMIMNNQVPSGVTEDMKEKISKEWPQIQEEILKEF